MTPHNPGVAHACTISSNNYLALARVFAESFLEHHPGSEVWVCVVDRPAPQIRYGDFPFHTVFVEELGIPNFHNFAFRYNILELNTAVKPYFLQHLRDREKLDRILYFDPDILVLSNLARLQEPLSRASAVLTPHITRPLDDAWRPSERIILMSGVYNLGFLGLRLDESTAEFLEWWQDRLYRFCVHDISHGMFVDQSWMDLAPALLDSVHIERSPAYNIAYWNLPHRPIERTRGRFMVDGEPVGFFHFSGYDIDQPDEISKHQNRISLSTREPLRRLFATYRERLLQAGHEELRESAYGYERFSDGRLIPALARSVLQRTDPYGLRWRDPFDAAAVDSYVRWFSAPIDLGRGVLTRAALSLWEERHDLQRHFPVIGGEHLHPYIDWLLQAGPSQRNGLTDAFVNGSVKKNAWGDASVVSRPHRFQSQAVEPNALESIDLSSPGGAAAWLNEPLPRLHRAPLITRLAMRLYDLRPDVQSAYPNPLDSDQYAFAAWFVNSAAAEYHLHRSLVTPVETTFPRRERMEMRYRRLVQKLTGKRPLRAAISVLPELDAHHPLVRRLKVEEERSVEHTAEVSALPLRTEQGRTPSLNLVGHFSAPTGVGQIARGSRFALELAGAQVAEISLDEEPWARIVRNSVQQPRGAPFPVTLIHSNADETPRALSLLPTASSAASYRIGYWFWELSYFPIEWADRFEMLDEVWVPTEFCRAAIAPISPIPVRLVPPCVPPPGEVRPDRSRFRLNPSRFYFFFAFDVASIPERKNPFALIDAFRMLATRTRRDIGLVLKVNQASRDTEFVDRLREQTAGTGVELHLETLGREDLDDLFASCDAYVSLHRSEGLGIPPIESMYLGKPVIATNYGGVTDFLNETTGYPVRYHLKKLDRDYPPYPRGAVWAEPDVEQAAEMMLRVLNDPEEAARKSQRARTLIMGLYGPEAAGSRFTAEIDRITRATLAKEAGLPARPAL